MTAIDKYKFRDCPDCGHANVLGGCECVNEGCVCYKKRTGNFRGNKKSVNGAWRPNYMDRRYPYRD